MISKETQFNIKRCVKVLKWMKEHVELMFWKMCFSNKKDNVTVWHMKSSVKNSVYHKLS